MQTIILIIIALVRAVQPVLKNWKSRRIIRVSVFFLDFAYVGIFRFAQNFDLETATNEIIIMIFVTYIAPQAKILRVFMPLIRDFLWFYVIFIKILVCFQKIPT